MNGAGGQLFLVKVSDFHLGLLPNELAGVMKALFRPRAKAQRALAAEWV
ncbi:hypothetical protein [Aromatoleum buckelii]|nr:hypothetical protein [Aromatoleum buckelii]MCK0512731.1 hypothetical protein [Aromatoleum buckelii]